MPADGSQISNIVQAEGPDPIDVAAGARVRMRRKQMGVSQEALAEACGVTFQQVQKYERAANRISLSMLKRIADRLEAPCSWLMGESEGAPAATTELTALLSTPAGHGLLEVASRLSVNRLRALSKVAEALALEDAE